MVATAATTWAHVGQRIAAARGALGFRVDELAQAAGVARVDVLRVEAGHGALSAGELARLASALGVGPDWLLGDSPPSVRSLRAERPEGASVERVDLLLDQLARDVEQLRTLGLLQPGSAAGLSIPMPDTAERAALAAAKVRETLGAPPGPLLELDRHAEALGLHVLCVDLGPEHPDGAYVALEPGGVILVNGCQPGGRRRFTLAHEIGHHVFADEYATDWVATSAHDTEKLINAFAVHLLLPHDEVVSRWHELRRARDPRAAALVIAVEYRVSWSTACAQCQRFRLIDDAEYASLRVLTPTRGDHVELDLRVVEELVPPSLSPAFARAVVSGYKKHQVTATRAIEMLRGTLEPNELPYPDEIPLDAYASDLSPEP